MTPEQIIERFFRQLEADPELGSLAGMATSYMRMLEPRQLVDTLDRVAAIYAEARDLEVKT